MGYTHYYSLLDGDFDFAAMFLRASIIVKEANKSGVICVLKLNDSMSSFTIEGVGDNICETFVWPPNKKDYCKTARLPYDTVVCACLLSAKYIYDDKVKIDSDGEWDDDWDKAKQLYYSTFKEEAPCLDYL